MDAESQVTQPWRIRLGTPADGAFLEAVATRLTIGIPPWRDPAAILPTVRQWLRDDLARMGADSTVLIAEAPDGTPVGVAAISRSKHYSGTPQADLGELAVVAETEGQGAGSALLAAAEAWARQQGLAFVELATGAANSRARAFYARHGYGEEDVRLTKVL
jgi:GNAT superfamily N-acetyltransferase